MWVAVPRVDVQVTESDGLEVVEAGRCTTSLLPLIS